MLVANTLTNYGRKKSLVEMTVNNNVKLKQPVKLMSCSVSHRRVEVIATNDHMLNHLDKHLLHVSAEHGTVADVRAVCDASNRAAAKLQMQKSDL